MLCSPTRCSAIFLDFISVCQTLTKMKHHVTIHYTDTLTLQIIQWIILGTLYLGMVLILPQETFRGTNLSLFQRHKSSKGRVLLNWLLYKKNFHHTSLAFLSVILSMPFSQENQRYLPDIHKSKDYELYSRILSKQEGNSNQWQQIRLCFLIYI